MTFILFFKLLDNPSLVTAVLKRFYRRRTSITSHKVHHNFRGVGHPNMIPTVIAPMVTDPIIAGDRRP